MVGIGILLVFTVVKSILDSIAVDSSFIGSDASNLAKFASTQLSVSIAPLLIVFCIFSLMMVTPA